MSNDVITEKCYNSWHCWWKDCDRYS